jgi:hypothetical protein
MYYKFTDTYNVLIPDCCFTAYYNSVILVFTFCLDTSFSVLKYAFETTVALIMCITFTFWQDVLGAPLQSVSDRDTRVEAAYAPVRDSTPTMVHTL